VINPYGNRGLWAVAAAFVVAQNYHQITEWPRTGFKVRRISGMKTAFALALTLAFAGCSSFDTDSFRKPDFFNYLKLPSMSAPVAVEARGPVKPEDLVDNQGQCASVPMAAADPNAAPNAAPAPAPQPAPNADATGGDPVTIPPGGTASSGIGLGMTECDVVRRAGAPEKIEFGTNERSERSVTLTYIHGMRPGIYTFASGRLVSIERAPEPPAPVKPVKPVNPKRKPKPSAT